MTIHEYTQEALKGLKGKSLKEKAAHIFTYYKVPIFAVLAVCILLGGIIYAALTRKDVVLSGCCINASASESSDSFLADFSEYSALSGTQEVLIAANLYTGKSTLSSTMQALTVRSAAQDIDFLASDLESCRLLVAYGYYWDLTELPEPQKAQLSPYFLYTERETPSEDLPLLTKAEDLQDPVPVALRIPNSKLSRAYRFGQEDVVILLIPNSPRKDMLYSFLSYISE